MSDARVIVAGASGFAGALAASLVHRHPRLDLAAATARADAGERLDRLYPRYRVPVELTELDLDRAADSDAAIVAYPHGAAAEVVARFIEAGLAVVDISADFRLRDPAAYEETYGEHGAPELLDDAVYGLTELRRDEVRGARLVANPGCYPTAALLALAPLAEAGLAGDIVISAASGVSGAGRGGGGRLHFVSVDENFTPYGVDGHRHLPEIVQELEVFGNASRVTFVPHLLPLDQGLTASCFVAPTRDVDADELRRLYRERYEGETFVEVVDDPPGVREVRDTNLCRIHVAVDGTGRALAFAAIDNLWKGAAGQAIQNLNLMLGFDETEGLL
ncbi:MAG TPA: N-acetyl-gamma-glutamyl-phosphate reductase [Solirubrobacterales bacterium]|nr:N-acetyl-gamma-glutamyl-phosphate reductase [Solirubrobacterales bacterium]